MLLMSSLLLGSVPNVVPLVLPARITQLTVSLALLDLLKLEILASRAAGKDSSMILLLRFVLLAGQAARLALQPLSAAPVLTQPKLFPVVAVKNLALKALS